MVAEPRRRLRTDRTPRAVDAKPRERGANGEIASIHLRILQFNRRARRRDDRSAVRSRRRDTRHRRRSTPGRPSLSLTPVRATRTLSIARSPRRDDAESLTRASAGLNRARARDPIARFASIRSTAQTWTSSQTSSARARRARPRRRRRSSRRRRPRSRRSRLRARASSVASNDGDARASEIPTSAAHLSSCPVSPRPVSST